MNRFTEIAYAISSIVVTLFICYTVLGVVVNQVYCPNLNTTHALIKTVMMDFNECTVACVGRL